MRCGDAKLEVYALRAPRGSCTLAGMRSSRPAAAILAAALAVGGALAAQSTARPHVLLILADDLGYGDLSCYNAEAKVETPHLDRLATQGLRFTDAHSPSTVCTPTRYSLLTGRMAFRTGFRSVFVGIGGPNLIEAERPTLGSLLRGAGYRTAMVGKWHVGLSFRDAAGERVADSGIEGIRRVDFSKPIADAPVHRGFDSFFGTACCPTTDWLYAWIVDNRVPVPPSLEERRGDRVPIPQHPYSNDCRPGLIAPDYDLETVDLEFLDRSRAFLKRHVAEHPDQPFFLFHSMQAVHLPSLAARGFQGATDAGPHGDFLREMDWVVGELLGTLDELGVADDTLVIFCSDNGPEVPTVLAMRRDHDHDGARPWRGMKRDAWEGGPRTPMLVRWPGHVPAGRDCGELTSLTDVYATLAALTGQAVPDTAAEDSFDMSEVWLGAQRDAPVRPYLLQQTISLDLSIRRGRWKLLDHQGSGGNRYDRGRLLPYALPETDPDAPGQLYDLEVDPGETTNLWSERPEVVAELKALLEASKASGRSAPRRDG